jgi:DNA mismatch repair protein MutS
MASSSIDDAEHVHLELLLPAIACLRFPRQLGSIIDSQVAMLAPFARFFTRLRGPREHARGARGADLFSILRTPATAVPRAARPVDPDVLYIDAQTFRDLEIFEGEGGAPSLFDLINRTRTDGGAVVLRGRLRRPFSSVQRIRDVQDSLRYINEHRAAFDLLPAEGIVAGIEAYLHSGLPVLTTGSRIELFTAAVEIRFGDVREYAKIVFGVQRTAPIIRSLVHLTTGAGLDDPPGELGPLIREMRELADQPWSSALPDEDSQLPFWRVLEHDRVLRFDQRDSLDRLLHLVFELDALVSLADATRQRNFVMPEVHDGPTEIRGDGVFHPFLTVPVPNPLRLDQQRRLLFLTGPNMAGKTTYLRACGTAVFLAHVGMGVPATTFRFSPCNAFFSAISLVDNVREGVSFFRAEALRMKAIAQAVANGRRVIALLDEPFRGTNVKDALDASAAVLVRLARKEDSLFLVASHLIELGPTLAETGDVDCCRFEASEEGGHLQFDYVLRPGISSQRLGVRVLHEEGVFELLD